MLVIRWWYPDGSDGGVRFVLFSDPEEAARVIAELCQMGVEVEIFFKQDECAPVKVYPKEEA